MHFDRLPGHVRVDLYIKIVYHNHFKNMLRSFSGANRQRKRKKRTFSLSPRLGVLISIQNIKKKDCEQSLIFLCDRRARDYGDARASSGEATNREEGGRTPA